MSTFNYVVSNPSYSGIKKRSYDRANEVDTEITVETIPLDMVIPENYKIDFIKIDVEGGEFQVLKGAVDSITKFKPIIIFEHGIGASDHYGTKPEEVFNLLANCNLQIATMEMWLKGQKSFTLKEFEQQFYQRLNYYFIAYPK
ncbi:MAG: FkbM family methyltransferase [Sporocytophaga sp.]|nr:FkbM family methyltransferase [Sporocytophaga sp.]